jgi:hypothetical protein
LRASDSIAAIAPIRRNPLSVERANRGNMPKILIHHDVDDTEGWLAATTREEVFGPLGVTDIKTYTNPQKPTQVGLTMDVPDLDALLEMLNSPEAAEAMKKDGVHGDTVVLCVES